MPDSIDGAPYVMKVARTVWAQGKGGDSIKALPMSRLYEQNSLEFRKIRWSGSG